MSAQPGSAPGSATRTSLAWGVHLFTASGAVVAAAALLDITHGNLTRAALLMLLALVIDAVDGTLARAVGVAEAVPGIDGRRLDDMVDFLNYVIVPAVFLVADGRLAGAAWAGLPILASAYGFSQTDAKTDDDFFLGFPSYWNVLALYVYVLDVGRGVTTGLVVLLSVLVFVPLKYLYPSKMGRAATAATGGGLAWVLALGAALLLPETAGRLRLAELSLLFPAWYLGASLIRGGLHRR